MYSEIFTIYIYIYIVKLSAGYKILQKSLLFIGNTSISLLNNNLFYKCITNELFILLVYCNNKLMIINLI